MRLLLLVTLCGVAVAFMEGEKRLSFFPEIERNAHFAGAGGLLDASTGDVAEKALSVAKSLNGIGEALVKDQYATTNGVNITHTYFRQHVMGIEVANGMIGVNVNGAGQVLNSWESVFRGPMPASATPKLSPEQAIMAFASYVGLDAGDVKRTESEATPFPASKFVYSTILSAEPVPAELAWVHDNEQLELTWSIVVMTSSSWWNAYVSANDGSVVALYDWVNDIEDGEGEYEAWSQPHTDPTFGPRFIETGPEEDQNGPAPIGWHDRGDGVPTTITWGNDNCAQSNPSGSTIRDCLTSAYRPDGGASLDFKFPVDLQAAPTTYVDASVANLFYWNAWIHDIFWLYGFNEVAGNFQETNLGRGGLGSDAVQANAQDGAGFNNANFATPPDGQRPRMRMYIWTGEPMRDGDFDGGIVMHEYGHGISHRLTGGPSTVSCLSGGQSGGMGEGWGDFWGVTLGQMEGDTGLTTRPMGEWAADRPGGIRPFPYSVSMAVNPQTYGLVGTTGYTGVHAIGSIWCQMLFDAYWAFVDVHGFDADWLPPTDGTDGAGNIQFWQLVVDGEKLQPCQPNFLQARDAIILADQNRYGGAHFCKLWHAFARRGAGASATSSAQLSVNEAFDVPGQC